MSPSRIRTLTGSSSLTPTVPDLVRDPLLSLSSLYGTK